MTDYFHTSNAWESGAGAALFDTVRFMADEHDDVTGPGYTIVEADDGTNRNTGPNLSDLGASNAWNPANATALSVGAWVVTESLDLANTNHFQLLFHLFSSTEWHIFLIPLEDFTTGGSSTAGSLPILPDTAYGSDASGTACSLASITGVARNTVVATEGNIIILTQSTTEATFYYGGEVDATESTSTTLDDRPYVQYYQQGPAEIIPNNSTDFWIRLSPEDKSTIFGYLNGSGKWVIFTNGNGGGNGNGNGKNGDDLFEKVGVEFQGSGVGSDSHFAGWLLNTRISPTSGLSVLRQDDSLGWIYSRVDGNETGVAIRWDGTNAVN